MIKEFKDVACFYTGIEGCEVIFSNSAYKNQLGKLTGYSAHSLYPYEITVPMNEDVFYLSIEEFKPVLYSLLDLNEQQAFVLCDFFGEYGDMPGRRQYESYMNSYGQMIVSWGTTTREKWCPANCTNWTPEQLSYLFKQGFDVFNLIKNNQAHDKNKLK